MPEDQDRYFVSWGRLSGVARQCTTDLLAGLDAQLRVSVVEVCIDGFRRNKKGLGDLLARATVRRHACHPQLARRQCLAPSPEFPAGPSSRSGQLGAGAISESNGATPDGEVEPITKGRAAAARSPRRRLSAPSSTESSAAYSKRDGEPARSVTDSSDEAAPLADEAQGTSQRAERHSDTPGLTGTAGIGKLSADELKRLVELRRARRQTASADRHDAPMGLLIPKASARATAWRMSAYRVGFDPPAKRRIPRVDASMARGRLALKRAGDLDRLHHRGDVSEVGTLRQDVAAIAKGDRQRERLVMLSCVLNTTAQQLCRRSTKSPRRDSIQAS